ncbi:hypothetical protein BJY04DRAFT_224497 [Aspergillus karnatakaensis]|uniref:uncharacterized protein n=1 Tax=Aspergillus karnatakaensis TaxID=1810916 RepID=UPI003CCCEAE8
MKFIIPTTFVALLATSASAASIPRSEPLATVVLTNESSGRSQSSNIAIDGRDLNVAAGFPALFNPFGIDSIVITGNLAANPRCTIHGKLHDGTSVALASVNPKKNYAKLEKVEHLDANSLKLNCV